MCIDDEGVFVGLRRERGGWGGLMNSLMIPMDRRIEWCSSWSRDSRL